MKAIKKISLQQNKIFIKFNQISLNPRNFVRFCFTIYTMRKCSQLKYKIGAKRPECLVYNKRLTEVPSVARGIVFSLYYPGVLKGSFRKC